MLIGDPYQLPPTVEEAARRMDGDMSMMERLLKSSSVPKVLLREQYRMHPAIGDFPSRKFYGGEVFSGHSRDKWKSIEKLTSKVAMPNPDIPIVLIDHSFHEQKAIGNKTSNINEVLLIKDLVKDLKAIGWKDIGVLAAYAAQVEHLTAACTKCPPSFIGTIDKFQGRENEVIIISTVRGNFDCKLGFLQDDRRMNVALTRSRSLLVVVCNTRTFENHVQTWRPWLQYCRTNNLVLDSQLLMFA